MYDVIVIGGGIVGASVAYHLASQGAKTVLYDRQDVGRATYAGAGILAPEISVHASETWFQFAAEAVQYYPLLVDKLQQDGVEVETTSYVRSEMLRVAISAEERDTFHQVKKRIFERQKRRGQPAPADLHSISGAEAQKLFPALAPAEGVIYYRHSAKVDGQQFTQALCQAAEKHALEIKIATVEQLHRSLNRVTGVVVEGETIQADHVVIAGGAWSKEFNQQVGLSLPIKPQRGQIAHLKLYNLDTSTWPIISGLRGHYIVPWPKGHIVVGATREDGTGFQPRTTAIGVQEVLTEALRVAPGLAQAEVQEIRVGLRPVSEDGLPILGSVPTLKNLYLATGHGPTGLQLGPYSGKLIADLILGQAIKSDISAFNISRFA